MSFFVLKNECHNDMCYDEIELCVQNTSTIIINPNNINGRTYMITLKEMKSSLQTLITFASQL